MLTRLQVNNLTSIEQADIELATGLTAISGESGAGKSMLINAVRMIAGDKPDEHLIGPSGSEAYVEAEFDSPIPAALSDVAAEDEPLILARRLRKNGPTRSLCSGRTCSVEQLAQASEELVSLTGQHAARTLTDPATQLRLIDRAGGLQEERKTVTDAFQRWREQERALRQLQERMADSGRHAEQLRADIELIRAIDPQPGEVEELTAERDRLAHIDALRQATMTANSVLNADEDSVGDRLAHIVRELEGVADHDGDVRRLTDTLMDLSEQLSDAGSEARDLAESYEGDPGRLMEVEQRLSALQDLRRRFANLPLELILERGEQAERELAELDDSDTRLVELEAAAVAARQSYDKASADLTKRRQAAAKKLSKETDGHLHELGLAGAKLVVEFERVTPSAGGVDAVRMLLAANAGLAPAPLDKGASGGELSRVNLALLLATSPRSGTFIFDEVDSGVGGDTAHIVAAKLKALSEVAQVLVVTHLAQVAIVADQHLVVRKTTAGGQTRTVIAELADECAREQEVARLIGADATDEQAARTAAQLVRAGAR